MEEEPCGKEVEHCVSGSGIHETMLPKRENSRAEVSGMRARERNNSTQHSTAQHSTASSTSDDVRFPREVNSKEGMGETAEGLAATPRHFVRSAGGSPMMYIQCTRSGIGTHTRDTWTRSGSEEIKLKDMSPLALASALA